MARLLIVERDPAIASLLQSAICRAVPCEVTMVHDRDSATTELEKGAFELLLLDVGLFSDGLEILREVRDENDRCEVIALTTGIIEAPLMKTLAEADVFAVVMKPFDVAQLTGIVAESLRLDRAADPNNPLVYRVVGDKPTHD